MGIREALKRFEMTNDEAQRKVNDKMTKNRGNAFRHSSLLS